MSLALRALARHGETGRPDNRPVPWLKKGMQRHAVLGGRPGLEEFRNKLERSLRRHEGNRGKNHHHPPETDPLATLPLESALAIVTHLAELTKKLPLAAS